MTGDLSARLAAERRAHLAADARPPLVTPEQVRDLVLATALPGLPGLRATANIGLLPVPVAGLLLPRVFAAGPSVAGWQILLARLWTAGSSAVLAAAGRDHGAVRGWFRHADLGRPRLPILGRPVARTIPRPTRVYRGGQGCPGSLAMGCSWTERLWEASRSASRRVVREGEPVALTRTVRPSDVLMPLRNATRETVAEPRGHGRTVAPSPMQVAAFAARCARADAERQAFNRRVNSVPEGERLRGWRPDARPARAEAPSDRNFQVLPRTIRKQAGAAPGSPSHKVSHRSPTSNREVAG